MIATDFARNDCLLGKGRVTYDTLQREYRCNDCGGRLVRMWSAGDGEWGIFCGKCGGRDFIHECELQRQKAEAVEVLDRLPSEVAAN